MPMNFTDALNTPSSKIERPPLLPVGTYVWQVDKVPTFDTTADGKWDICNFQMRSISAEDDVDEDALADFEKGAGKLTSIIKRHSFMFDKEDEGSFNKSLFNLKRFLFDHLKVPGGDDQPLKQALQNALNQRCKGQIKWKADKNDIELQHDNIGRTAPVE